MTDTHSRSTPFDSLSVRVEGEVGYLGLDRPDTLNAFDMAMVADIAAAAEWFDTQAEVKVVVVHSTGRAFSSGFHLDQFRCADGIVLLKEKVRTTTARRIRLS